MIKLYIAKGFSLQAGSQIGFLINAKETIEINDESRSTDLENIKTLDFGVNFGVGYQLKLNIFLRYVIT